jgi:hypothetical protein
MKCISASFFIAFALVLHGYSYVHRLALFIGSDEGLAHERPLKYAAHDAREMAQLFKESGAFEEDRIYLLENQSITRVREAVQEISGRIKELKKREGKVLSLFYYSGHGSADALHIMGKKYSRTELITQLENLQSDLKIMIVDACESGNLLRSKGGEVIMDHSIQKVDNLNNKGTIVLSSSSRGELAQESENYRGGGRYSPIILSTDCGEWLIIIMTSKYPCGKPSIMPVYPPVQKTSWERLTSRIPVLILM